MSIVGNLVSIYPYSVDSESVGKIFDGTGREQGIPSRNARCRPGGYIKKKVVGSISIRPAVACPYREAEVVADLWADFPAF